MPKLEKDSELVFEADKSGMIHVRKHPGESKILEGYGTEDFGVSWREPNWKLSPFALVTSIGAAGFFAWKYRDWLLDQVQVLLDYSLLLEEAKND